MGQIGVVHLKRQLGSERLEVRLGAIDTLQRVMIDSASDHPAIVELCRRLRPRMYSGCSARA